MIIHIQDKRCPKCNKVTQGRCALIPIEDEQIPDGEEECITCKHCNAYLLLQQFITSVGNIWYYKEC